MSQKFFAATAALGLCAAVPAMAATLTLNNPGFESPNASAGDVQGTTGWMTFTGTEYTSASDHHAGSQAAKGFGSPAVFEQAVAVSDPAGTTYTGTIYAGYLSSDPLTGAEGGFINMDFLDSGGNVLATVTGAEEGQSLTRNDAADTFKPLTVTAPSVAGTASVRLDLVVGPYDGLTGTSGGAAFFDDATLSNNVSSPEPASIGLLGLGGMAMAARRRRSM